MLSNFQEVLNNKLGADVFNDYIEFSKDIPKKDVSFKALVTDMSSKIK